MEREITPEPSAQDEEAIDAALARLLEERVDPYSAWWREGIRENLELDGPPGNVIPPSGRLQGVATRRPQSPPY
jgi:hypothetical protein